MAKGNRISIGVAAAADTTDADAYVAQSMAQIGADFVIMPLVAAAMDEQAVRQTVERGYFATGELAVRSATNAYCIVGSLAHVDWTGSSGDVALVAMAMEYTGYTGLRGVVAPTINECDPRKDVEYARMLLEHMGLAVARVRIGKDAPDAWSRWNAVRHACNHDARLQLVLEIGAAPDAAVEIGQWRAEPVQIVQIATSMFTKNRAGYPVLTRAHQSAMLEWMDLGVALAVGSDDGETAMVSDCIKYLRHLAAQREAQTGADDAASAEYYDVLQTPLQPLADHLDAETYEVFEQDAAKYDAYEDAMHRTIRDLSSGHNGRQLVLTVAGAGRGPLVARALQAARRCDADVKVYAVEKNPSAMVELQRKNAELWGGCVTLVHADMRRATAVPERADILVSELLGSLGDNELSPECLAAAIPLLLAPGGVCIPRKYTAYIAPLSSTALFNRVRSAATYNEPARLETPFVVNIHAANVLADAQPLWSFEHISTASEKGQRSACRAFDIRSPSLLHGLAGYFDAELYGGVELSICPATHTPAMHSWFPMFFPLMSPLTVHAGDSLAVHMWRRVSDSKVWYEWALRVEGCRGCVSAVHNLNAHQHWIDK
ncbi:hypothetical protein LPJ81_004088 [Coemansia sp. IMI 209127]|nr:hypothetical protein LPJ81_004088 [Coemansia sp. IMI 209127]